MESFYLEVPFERYQVRSQLAPRTDSRGSEDFKERPWVVLSGPAVHQRGLFIASSITHAEDRRSDGYLLEVDVRPSDVLKQPPHLLDLQQLWTFPEERDDSGNLVGTLCPETKCRTVAERLRGRLFGERVITPDAACPLDSSPPRVGQVVWIDLVGDTEDEQSDLFTVCRAFEQAGILWLDGPTSRMPALVILSSATASSFDPYVLRLLTVVPLIYCPSLLQEYDMEAPKIRLKDAFRDGEPIYLAPLTQLLLTLDYHPKPLSPKNKQGRRYAQPRRVFLNNGPQQSWCVEPDELDGVLREVAEFLGLET